MLPEDNNLPKDNPINKYLSKELSKNQVIAFLSIIGLLVFLGIAFTFPFQKKGLAGRYAKPFSKATESSVPVVSPAPSYLLLLLII